MSMNEYVVRQRGGLWGVGLGDRLISAQPSQMEALGLAEALAGGRRFAARMTVPDMRRACARRGFRNDARVC